MRVTCSTLERYKKFMKRFGPKICREQAAGSNWVAGFDIDATASGQRLLSFCCKQGEEKVELLNQVTDQQLLTKKKKNCTDVLSTLPCIHKLCAPVSNNTLFGVFLISVCKFQTDGCIMFTVGCY